ncbi:retinol dehydrogenase [Colletotrichum filicis]|nr:retinol dehydrogenase [Colletotrichum filicis]
MTIYVACLMSSWMRSTSGFGTEFVKALLAKGDKVIAIARDTSKIARFREAGRQASSFHFFIASSSLKICASNSCNISQEDWNKVFQTHVFGPVGVARAFLPHFRARKSGMFIFMGSTAAWEGIPTLGAYCASESALRGAVEILNLELAPLGLKTLLVEPSFFRTELVNVNNTVYIATKILDYKSIIDPL